MSDAIYTNLELDPYSHPNRDAELLEQFWFYSWLKRVYRSSSGTRFRTRYRMDVE